MMISWIDLLSIYLICVAFCDLISICVVLVLFMLTASRSLFLYILTWMIKLILDLVNFLTILGQHYSSRSIESRSYLWLPMHLMLKMLKHWQPQIWSPSSCTSGCLRQDHLNYKSRQLHSEEDRSIVHYLSMASNLQGARKEFH
jgi:hypothetical protein